MNHGSRTREAANSDEKFTICDKCDAKATRDEIRYNYQEEALTANDEYKKKRSKLQELKLQNEKAESQLETFKLEKEKVFKRL